MNLYKILWSHIGGRPWTFIIRDFCYDNPLLLILIFVVAMLVYLHLKHEILWLSGGILLGHLFWGTKWIRGQKGDHCNTSRTTLQRFTGRGI